jgi:hypothetical protein
MNLADQVKFDFDQDDLKMCRSYEVVSVRCDILLFLAYNK